jgi:hypothetical protein
MTIAHVEYMGFKSLESAREYRLRVHQGASVLQDVTIVIANSAFLTKLVRYQDGPELCFHKLQRAVASSTETMPDRLYVSDADLADYAAAHAPKPTRRKPPVPSA